MYNAICGCDKYSDALLFYLSLSKSSIPRFRDCYLSKDFKKIIVYTRTGGANRELYEKELNELRKHKRYLTDYDDSFDNTYMSIEFAIDKKDKKLSKEFKNNADTRTGEERMKQALDEFEKNPEEAMRNNKGLANLTNGFNKIFSSKSKKDEVILIDKDGTVTRKKL